MMGLFSFCLYKLLHKMPTPLRTPQTSGYSSFHVSNLPLWSLKPPSSRRLKLSFFICPRVSARFLHCFCTVSRDAMGTLICKIRQRVQKLPGRKSRCFAQKRRKLKTSKIRVFCPVGSFNQRARDSSSLERTKIQRRIARFLVGFSFFWGSAHFLHTGGKAVFFLALSALLEFSLSRTARWAGILLLLGGALHGGTIKGRLQHSSWIRSYLHHLANSSSVHLT